VVEPLRVAVVASGLGGGGGIARYTAELLRHLGRRDDLEVLPVVPDEARPILDSLAMRNVAEIVADRGRGQVGRALWERHRLGAELERRGTRLVHGTKHLLPRTTLPTILTAYDVMPITWPQQFRLAKRVLLPRQYRAALEEATGIVSISETTRRRIDRLDPSLGGKVVVVPVGFTSELLEVEPSPLPGLEGVPFALVVGDLSPRKNFALLLDIWDDVFRATGGLELVAVGPDGWRSETTRRRLEQLVRRGAAVSARHVSDGRLRWCYEQARVVLYPTLEEGFGLPVVEALAFGAPVIASTDDAVVEAGQGLPTHVDARDRAGWTAAIVAASGRGREPGARPAPQLRSWADHAAGVVEVYRTVLDAELRRHRRGGHVA